MSASIYNTLNNTHSSLEEKCKEFGEVLGLSYPVSEQVLIAALNNETYSHNLLMSRTSQGMLEYLVKNPPKVQNVVKKTWHETTTKKTNSELLLKATNSLLKWGKTGFSTVSKEVVKIREDACLACPNLSGANSSLQKLLPGQKNDEIIGKRAANKFCGLCGCNVGKKIKLTSESCPGKHPEKEGYTRWNEAIK